MLAATVVAAVLVGAAAAGAPAAPGLPLAPSYTAAVVEFNPFVPQAPQATQAAAVADMQTNVDAMAEHVADAARLGAAIILFPEMGIAGFPFTTRASVVPYLQRVTPGSVPCAAPSTTLDAAIVRNVSCIAAQHRMVVVVGLPVANGGRQYNAQVAFGADGRVLGVHYKMHLFVGESAYFDTGPPVLNTFTAHFGVTFGMSICFEIFFHTPLVHLALDANVTDFSFITWWENTGTVPLLSAADMQSSVSRAFGVNFLAANTGADGYLSSGSGIYSAGEPLAFTFNTSPAGRTKLLTAKVPLRPARAAVTAAAVPPPQYSSGSRRITAAPVFNSTTVPVGGRALLVAASGGVTCEAAVTVSANATGGPWTFAAYANGGVFFNGLLPTTTCELVLCPAGNCTQLPLPSAGAPPLAAFSLAGRFPRRTTASCAVNAATSHSDPFVVYTPVTVADGFVLSPAHTSVTSQRDGDSCRVALLSHTLPPDTAVLNAALYSTTAE